MNQVRFLIGWMLVLCCWTLVQAEDEIHVLPLGNPATCWDLRLMNQGQIYSTGQDRICTWEELIQWVGQKRVIILGESHTNLEQHEKQAQLIEDLAKQGKRVLVGMEFFDRDQNSLLADWKDGKLSEAEFLAKSDWFNQNGYHYHYYRPIMEVAKQYHLPVYGLNIPRSVVHKVAQTGLDSLTPAEQAIVGEVKLDSVQHRYLIQRIFGNFAIASPGRFDRMYAAQCVWDNVMADSIVSALALHDADTIMVVIVGSGHVLYRLGIPLQINLSGEQVITVVFHEMAGPDQNASDPHFKPTSAKPAMPAAMPAKPAAMPANEPSKPAAMPAKPSMMPGVADNASMISRSLADIVISTKESEPPALPHWGLKLAMKDQKLIIAQASPQGIAFSLGWRKDDVILQVQGQTFQDIVQLQLVLLPLRWQDHITWQIQRADQTLTEEAVLTLPVEK